MVDIKKQLKYKNEQEELLNKLLEILNYNNDYTFYLYDLDNKKDLKESIIGLSDDIIKYYSSSICTAVNGKKCKRPYLSIIKYILKYHNKEFYTMDYRLDIEDKNKLRYSCCQRRRESLRKRGNKIILREKQKNKIIEEETKLSSYNCKSVDYNEFKKYITEKTKLNEKVREFYENELYRKLKWRSWIYQRKSEDNFLNNIEKTYGKKEDLLLCYGNWSNNKQMKYIMPTKGVGLRRTIEKNLMLY